MLADDFRRTRAQKRTSIPHSTTLLVSHSFSCCSTCGTIMLNLVLTSGTHGGRRDGEGSSCRGSGTFSLMSTKLIPAWVLAPGGAAAQISDAISMEQGRYRKKNRDVRTSRSLLRCDDRDFHDHGRLDHLLRRGQHGRVRVHDESESLLQVAQEEGGLVPCHDHRQRGPLRIEDLGEPLCSKRACGCATLRHSFPAVRRCVGKLQAGLRGRRMARLGRVRSAKSPSCGDDFILF